jgi:hemolysin activation/secretion protein
VRSYAAGVLSGDSGQSLSLELRHRLHMTSDTTNGTWQTLLFWDAGQVLLNQQPWASGSNTAALSGAGIGLRWQGAGHWHAQLGYAASLGEVPVQLSGSGSTREAAWLEIGARF